MYVCMYVCVRAYACVCARVYRGYKQVYDSLVMYMNVLKSNKSHGL